MQFMFRDRVSCVCGRTQYVVVWCTVMVASVRLGGILKAGRLENPTFNLTRLVAELQKNS